MDITEFTRSAAAMVAENDARIPAQRRPIEDAQELHSVAS